MNAMAEEPIPEPPDAVEEDISSVIENAPGRAIDPDVQLASRVGVSQYRALMALVETPNRSRAAELAGISRATLYRYLNDKDFLFELSRMRHEAEELALEELRGAALSSFRTLAELLDDPDSKIRLSAAKALWEYRRQLRENEQVRERLEFLEAAVRLKKAQAR